MTLPSSPPYIPSFDVPSSPLPEIEEAGELPVRASDIVPGETRKRPFSDYESSSEPWFSDDISDAEVGDSLRQDEHRRKRLVKGPWWKVGGRGGSLRRKAMAKREHVWNDSGVWLGSDSSEEQAGPAGVNQRPLVELEESDYLRSSPPPAPLSLTPGEEHAAAIINGCVDRGQEMVELSDLALTQLSDPTLRPLHQLIRHTHIDLTQPPSEDEFGPLTPSIQLYLSCNALSSLPSELFELENISVLSLRNNQLTHVPSAIGSLRNLKELHISQNSISWLPWEMLDLFCCGDSHRQIVTRPNPLLDPAPGFEEPKHLRRPKVATGEFMEHLSRWGETSGAFFQKMREWYAEEDEPWTIRHELELKLKLGRLKRTNHLQEASRAGMEVKMCCNEQLIYLASSAIRYFQVDGSPCRDVSGGRPLADSELYAAVMDPHIHVPPTTEHSAVPSLFEMSLRSMQANYDLQNPSEYPSNLSLSVTSALQQAAGAARRGNDCCSTCGRRYVIARAEWMEFWFNGFPSQECLTRDTVLPFSRRACSWACATPSQLGSFRS
ncbi:uncharacterized protein LTR77_002012 [Saxophila tyrrhenica]|uniref:Uncharacterized protein n=1 Tax=Saxophila tyrrhenica TaxID=1690608 RepID=A0AAV9PJ43_9PEZI|nr:hypothetical protein LTR77_002012 [Saxophila tyrrhenica]